MRGGAIPLSQRSLRTRGGTRRTRLPIRPGRGNARRRRAAVWAARRGEVLQAGALERVVLEERAGVGERGESRVGIDTLEWRKGSEEARVRGCWGERRVARARGGRRAGGP
jgi:hypothetical protein